MPEETRYVTVNGNVPNGGIPPGRMFFSVGAGPPLEPNLGRYAHIPPPAPSAPQNDGKMSQPTYSPRILIHGIVTGRGFGVPTHWPTMYLGFPPLPPPAPRTPHRAASSPPDPTPPKYQKPGNYIGGNILPGKEWTLITPSELTTIFFVNDGTRPCDAPNGHFPHRFNFTKHKAPTVMTVKDLMKGLGMPEGENFGVTEMEELGDNRFTAGMTIRQGSEWAEKTLRELGWSQRKSEAAPIWLLVKR